MFCRGELDDGSFHIGSVRNGFNDFGELQFGVIFFQNGTECGANCLKNLGGRFNEFVVYDFPFTFKALYLVSNGHKLLLDVSNKSLEIRRSRRAGDGGGNLFAWEFSSFPLLH